MQGIYRYNKLLQFIMEDRKNYPNFVKEWLKDSQESKKENLNIRNKIGSPESFAQWTLSEKEIDGAREEKNIKKMEAITKQCKVAKKILKEANGSNQKSFEIQDKSTTEEVHVLENEKVVQNKKIDKSNKGRKRDANDNLVESNQSNQGNSERQENLNREEDHVLENKEVVQKKPNSVTPNLSVPTQKGSKSKEGLKKKD